MRRIKAWALGLAMTLLGGIAIAQGPAMSPPPTSADVSATAPAPAPALLGGGRALTAADVDPWLDGFMPYALHAGDIAGAVVTVVKDGRVIAARGYGYADIATRRPVDPARTLFRPGSVSKLVTWTAVMQLVEAGKIDLDGDVNAYLDFRIPPRNGKPVTMRQIMTHTAGFEEAAKDLISYDPKAGLPLGTYLKRWTPHRIFNAGTSPAYSNWATTLAGYIVERVSGMPFDTYVERRIFAPIAMSTASFRQPLPRALASLSATGYPRASEKAKAFEMVVPAPAGALSASGLDMAKFMIAHLQNGRGLLSPATAAAMHNSPLDHVDAMSLVPPLNRMELGFFETNINGREVIAHLGDTENFHTSLHLFMNEGVGLYVSFNSAGREGAAHTVRGQLFKDFADRYFPSTVRDGRVDAKTAAQHARMMVGLWQNSRRSESSFVDVLNLFGQSEIELDDKGMLVIPALKGAGGAAQSWDEVAPFVWRDRYGHDRLAAKVVDGKVVRWSSDGFSPFMVFDRVPAARSSAWLLPLLYGSMAVLALTFLYWPVVWVARRRYAGSPVAKGRSFRGFRATRVMALLVLAVLGGWMWFVTTAFSDLDMLSSKSDALVWFLQIATAIILVGAVGITGWNVWLTWRDGRGWARRLWNILVLLATLLVLYFAATFGLMAMTVNY
jgi:CubicO group peptidase (beta-lactamase class C family)